MISFMLANVQCSVYINLFVKIYNFCILPMVAKHHCEKGGGENTYNIQSMDYLNGLPPKILF